MNYVEADDIFSEAELRRLDPHLLMQAARLEYRLIHLSVKADPNDCTHAGQDGGVWVSISRCCDVLHYSVRTIPDGEGPSQVPLTEVLIATEMTDEQLEYAFDGHEVVINGEVRLDGIFEFLGLERDRTVSATEPDRAAVRSLPAEAMDDELDSTQRAEDLDPVSYTHLRAHET